MLALLLAGPVLTLPHHIPLNPNEGWNAYLAARALAGDPARPLYPPPGAMVFNNYPPLSFPLLGLAGRLGGDMIVAGRLVALLALLTSAGLVAGCVRRMGGTQAGATLAGLLMALYAATSFHAYVAMDDPQWLAHAIMLAGLITLLPAGSDRPRPGRVAAAALLIVAGGFVKHNLVALPLAVTVWLAWYDRRALAVWCGVGALALLAGFGLATRLYGPAFLTDLLHHARTLTASGLADGVRKLAELSGLLLAAALLWAGSPQDPAARRMRAFVTLFLAIGAATGLLERMGDGVSANAHLETLVAACLAVGLVRSRPVHEGGRPFAPALPACLSTLPLLLLAPIQMTHEVRDLRALPARTTQWRTAIDYLRATPGPVACETLALCYWASKDETVDFFNLTQALLAGHQAYPFADIVRRHGFALVELDRAAHRHADALAHSGHDPLTQALDAAGYVPVRGGADRTIFLAAPTIPGRPI
ncbi:glycosyltransferase family 39 protein [Gluconacetobacter takamatsuzukensis]|uniref:Glycosyltransferase RgtA/B/C/D-like domain-containing protein n=1 Tax=Gluconacetobacter takamatsuzukensis TaxID=1286190 RepID=A0A7W4KBS2_9PROT|nr:glycosyltransferase family 39 protein [Gluconacetobacter takamatsuzukensis]MBB2204019.1 hypothetical protein [Gluconacetobacter takamatsuzukensis]